MFNKYIILCSTLFLSVSSYAQTILSPTVDTYTQSSKADDSFASEQEMMIKRTITGTNDRETWLKFDASGQPSTSEQVLIRLVKTGGNEGNISIVGSPNIDASITWGNAPAAIIPIPVGGYRSGDTCYFDVTAYVNEQLSNANTEFSFKLFSTSDITSTMKFVASEGANRSNGPELQFYSESHLNIPVFSTYESVEIPTENGTFTGDLLGEHSAPDNERSIYGGWSEATSTATGFFHTEKDCEGVWHIIDPQGHLFYSAGLNTVFEGGGVALPDELHDLGLNTMGSWSDEDIQGLAYCPRFNVIVNFKNSDEAIKTVYEDLEILPVFEPTFASFCASLAQNELPQYANDPWVLGFFLDNELLFHRDQLSLSLTLLDERNAQYQEANTWMIAKYGDGYSLNDITDEDVAAYQGHVAETYFNVITSAFRAVDADHMLIGTRFHAGVKYIPEIFTAAGKYLDVLSINYYNRFEPEEYLMDMWMEQAQIPFMVTEFYTKGTDSGLGNADGAGWEVPTQQDRANWFENWMLKLLRSKGSVGYHWFRYRDKDGQDSNKGLFDEQYEPYQLLAESFAKVSLPIYSLRSHVLYGNGNYNGVINCEQELCGEVDKCDLITSDKTLDLENEKGLYPNPTTGLVYLNNPEGASIKIYNSSNQEIKYFKASTTHQKIDLSDYSNGIYFIQIQQEGRVETLSLIKQ